MPRPEGELAGAAVIGAAGGLMLAFVSTPAGITTLIHHALGIAAGPGTGMGMLVGPWAAFCCLVAACLVRHPRGATVAGLAFSLSYSLASLASLSAGQNPGMVGSPRTAAGLAIVGLVADAAMARWRRMPLGRRLALASALADSAFLGYLWVAVFPLTKGWVTAPNAAIILALSLPCAAAAGSGLTRVALAVAGEDASPPGGEG